MIFFSPFKALSHHIVDYKGHIIRFKNYISFQIRLFVLEVVESFLDKKGENYLTVLPDSVPLLAEALEDDNSKVEAKCRKLIRKMEDIFGHSIESYFE